VLEHLQDVFTGGTDTSAIAVGWALAALINHSNIMEKARLEIDLVVGKNRHVEESDIPKLSYLQAIVKETLRLHPAGGPFITRDSTEDTRIGGYHIPAKTRLLVNVQDKIHSFTRYLSDSSTSEKLPRAQMEVSKQVSQLQKVRESKKSKYREVLMIHNNNS
jgi:hypothetical protein